MPKVYNKYHKDVPPDAVYIGRPSKWGNPWSMGGRCPREEAVRFHREWFLNQSGLVEAAKTELRGKDLVCFCAPLACHGDILLEIANTPQVLPGGSGDPVDTFGGSDF